MSEAFAHRAIVAVAVMGLVRVRAGIRVGFGGGAGGAEVDVLVITREDELATARISADGAVVVMVRSPLAQALEDAAGSIDPIEATRDDAYAHALRWAEARRGAPMATIAIDGEKLDGIVASAARGGLSLVEPDLAVRARGVRTSPARALFATITSGARARPLVFVRSARAPKGGLARLKVERLTDGWVAPGAARSTAQGTEAITDLTTAAITALEERGRPVPFKELLREARERWAMAARAAGRPSTPATTDARDLATALHRLAVDERVTLSMLDPGAPGWVLAQSPS